MRKTIAKLLLVAAVFYAGMSFSQVHAEGSTAKISNNAGEMKATVTKTAGSVLIKSRGSITWHDAKVNEALYAGDTIETKKDGKIQIKLDNNNVIDLKPDSQLLLKKLTENPGTGEYENLFESGYGVLRAKVGKIKDNSKFEVKTPVAVGAVRGTVMYLHILPNLTIAFFEEGNGYLASLFSNKSIIVPAGGCASADDHGNINQNCNPGDLNHNWGTGPGAEGYSPPAEGYSPPPLPPTFSPRVDFTLPSGS